MWQLRLKRKLKRRTGQKLKMMRETMRAMSRRSVFRAKRRKSNSLSKWRLKRQQANTRRESNPKRRKALLWLATCLLEPRMNAEIMSLPLLTSQTDKLKRMLSR